METQFNSEYVPAFVIPCKTENGLPWGYVFREKIKFKFNELHKQQKTHHKRITQSNAEKYSYLQTKQNKLNMQVYLCYVYFVKNSS